jgi:hypothetical protein
MRRSKYRAVKTTVDGIRFDSKKEARRYQELKLMEKAGKIRYLVVKPEAYDLHCPAYDESPGLELEKVCEYRPDFTYRENGKEVVEDVKGVRTPLYRLKKKWMKLEYGIEIKET